MNRGGVCWSSEFATDACSGVFAGEMVGNPQGRVPIAQG